MVHQLFRYIFWLEVGVEARIKRATLSGTEIMMLADDSSEHVRHPRGLTVDYMTGRFVITGPFGNLYEQHTRISCVQLDSRQ